MKALSIATMLLFMNSIYATTHLVGKKQTYLSPNVLYLAEVVQDGDTILIDGEVFVGNEALAVWLQNDLVIKGVEGRPHLMADGQYIWGKGIWVLAGDNITLENIEFSGATVPDKNGAGIRLDGSGLTVRHCYFHDNENGILTNNTYEGTVTIEYSEFEGGGFGDGFSHNIYIGHNERLIFQFNYVHHAKIGHQLKSRADENIIRYNRLSDESTGNSSRIIDIPNGGFTIIMGNILMQGSEAPNYNVLGYGLEGLINPFSQLYVINNSFVSERSNALFIDIHPDTEFTDVSNNIFAGQGYISYDDVTFDFVEGNVLFSDIEDFDFKNADMYDYQLNQQSIAIDVGFAKNEANGYLLIPEFQYVHPLQSTLRLLYGPSIDAGAYEYSIPLKVTNSIQTEISVFPNPGSATLHVSFESGEFEELFIWNSMGQLVKQTTQQKVETDQLEDGFYQVQVMTKDGILVTKPWVKL